MKKVKDNLDRTWKAYFLNPTEKTWTAYHEALVDAKSWGTFDADSLMLFPVLETDYEIIAFALRKHVNTLHSQIFQAQAIQDTKAEARASSKYEQACRLLVRFTEEPHAHFEKDNSLKILVSTKATQGKRDTDFSYVPENEIVTFSFSCDRETDIDGPCGCLRSMAGIECFKATTTVKIVDVPLTIDEYTEKLTNYANLAGYGKYPIPVKKLLSVSRSYPVGTVLEKRGERFVVRKQS